MSIEEQKRLFHALYWLGKELKSFQDIQENMKCIYSNISLKDISNLYKATEEDRKLTKNYRQRWRTKFSAEQRPSFGDFINAINSKDPQCAYCGINKSQISALDQIEYEKQKKLGIIKEPFGLTKRPTRKTLEIDRMIPVDDYHIKNIVLACSWCNNAKTDTFTYEEFKNLIGPGIRKVWNIRLHEAGLPLIPEESESNDKDRC